VQRPGGSVPGRVYGDHQPFTLLAGAAYALGELHGIASRVAARNEKLGDLLEHQRVEGYFEDADPD
jgi:hypothetical protein